MSDCERALRYIESGNMLEGLATLFGSEEGDDRRVALNRALYAPPHEDTVAAVREAQEAHTAALPHATGHERTAILYNLGCFALYSEDVLGAKLRFGEVLEQEPDFAPARHNLGYTHELMADTEEAQAAYREVLQRRPDFTLSRVNLGLLLIAEGDTEGGLEELRQVVEAEPGNMGAPLYLCRALLTRGTEMDADAVLDLFAARDGWDLYADLKECHAYALYRKGDLDSAETAFRSLLADDEHNLFARMGLMKVLAQQQAFPELLRHAEQYQQQTGDPNVAGIVDKLQHLAA